MEDRPREQELSFQENAPELQTAAEPNQTAAADYVQGSAAENEQTTAFEAAENPEVETVGIAEAAEAVENPAVPVAVAADAQNLLRSRQPMNCPAGTVPLDSLAKDKIEVTRQERAIAGKSYGLALRTLREYNNLTMDDLEQITLIQKRYLEALENENLEALPALVYVIGFIRTLMRYYKISDAASDKMVAKLKEQLEYSCNDEFINSLDVDRSGAEVNERKLKRIVLILAGAVAAVIVAVLLVVVLVRSNNSQGNELPEPIAPDNTADVQKFDANTIYPLLEPPTLDLPKVPVAE